LSRPTITHARTAGFKAVFADRGNKDLLVAMLNQLPPTEAAVKDIIEYLDRVPAHSPVDVRIAPPV
jgi:hypothetical protein